MGLGRPGRAGLGGIRVGLMGMRVGLGGTRVGLIGIRVGLGGTRVGLGLDWRSAMELDISVNSIVSRFDAGNPWVSKSKP